MFILEIFETMTKAKEEAAEGEDDQFWYYGATHAPAALDNTRRVGWG